MSTYKTGTVSVTNGNAVVTGSGTAWAVSLVTGGMFSSAGLAVPIASVNSDTSLTLDYPWPGTKAAGAAYSIALENSEAASVANLNSTLSRVLVTLSLAGITPDASGTIAERNALTLAVGDKGFLFLHAELGYDFEFYRWSGSAWVGPFATRGVSGIVGIWVGPWLTANVYSVNDIVGQGGNSYICVAAHTSGTFATDLAAGKWQLVAQKGDAGVVQSIVAGSNVTIDNTDPAHPVVASVGGVVQSIVAGSNVSVNNTDPAHPVVSVTALSAALSDTSSAIADPSKFWNPTYGGLPGTGIAHKLNRVLVGEATAGSLDYPQTTKDWLETLIIQTTSTAQLASVSALGGLGLLGAARTSDYRTWQGGASGGAEGVVGIGWNDDTGTGTPISVGGEFRGFRKAGVNGITAGAQISAANQGSTVDITPSGGMVSGSTVGLLLTNGPGPTGYANPISAHLAMGSGTGTEVARKGIVSLQAALDTSLGAGGGGVALEMYRGQSIRWLNSGGTADAEMWGDASGFKVNGNLNAGRLISSASVLPGYFKNTADSAANVVLRLESARATRANNDAVTIDWYIANSAGTATAAARFSASLANVTAGAETAAFAINITNAGVGLSKGFVWTPSYAAPSLDGGASLGITGTAWSGLFMTASGSVNVGSNKVLGARDTGWTAMTGTSDKATSYATSSVTLAQLAGRVMALQTALTTHGIIGA